MHQERSAERGGITILVALMLLVFLTITAIGMSRNAFREVVISGTTRQGAMVRNVADSGVEYGILWIEPPSLRPGATGPAAQLQALTTYLQTNVLYGLAYNLDQTAYTASNTATPPAELQVPPLSGNGFNLALTAMGKMPMVKGSSAAWTKDAAATAATRQSAGDRENSHHRLRHRRPRRHGGQDPHRAYRPHPGGGADCL